MPVDCVIDETCWVVNRVDVDPGPQAVDHTCGDHTYDGHKGIDIAIAGGDAMRRGVSVVAAAGGRVIGTRDELPDVDVTVAGRASVTGRECGNGVIIETPDGWRHQYCHMRRGSVKPRNGDRVERGDHLGFVGSSGLSQFPHLHLQVSKDGTFYDPDTGAAMGEQFCGKGDSPMWDTQATGLLSAGGSAIYLTGFATNVPQAADARAGQLSDLQFDPMAAAMLVWFDIFRPDRGDQISVLVTGPDGGEVVQKDLFIKKNQARRFIYVGKRRAGQRWPAGEYTAEVRLKRRSDGVEQLQLFTTRVPPEG